MENYTNHQTKFQRNNGDHHRHCSVCYPLLQMWRRRMLALRAVLKLPRMNSEVFRHNKNRLAKRVIEKHVSAQPKRTMMKQVLQRQYLRGE
jgi:hypothetical protein